MEPAQLRAIVMAYNADWSVMGGLSYLRDTIRGEEPCELCKITYGGVTKKGEWVACEKDIRAPVKEVYRNQLSDELAAAIGGSFPMVLAETTAGYRVLVRPEQMDACGGDPKELHRLLLAGLEQQAVRIGA